MFCGEEGWSRGFRTADQIRAASSAVLKEREERTEANAQKPKLDQPRSSERLRASPAAHGDALDNKVCFPEFSPPVGLQ